MAGNDMKKQVLNLIHDFASENSQKERRVVDLKEQIKEQESELDATNVELEEAKRLKETAEQELNQFQLQLALNDTAIQPLEDEISAVGSDVQALKALKVFSDYFRIKYIILIRLLRFIALFVSIWKLMMIDEKQHQDKKKTKKKNKNKKKKKKKKNKNSETSKKPKDAEATDDSSSEHSDRPSNNGEVEGQDLQKDAPAKAGASEVPVVILESPAPSTEAAFSSGAPSTDATTLSQLSVMRDMLDQLIDMQKEMQRQMNAMLIDMQKEMQRQMNAMVSDPINKEGKRLEASLGWSIEKAVKAITEALWTRFQEENVIHEKLNRDCTQQITNLITIFINIDLPQMQIAAIGPSIARAISPALEKSTSNPITESFQKGVGEKAVNQLEKSVVSKLEATVARQIQAQFLTSGKQALQDALRSKMESSIIPAFGMSCKAMFEQTDATFQKGLLEHTTAAQQQLESTHSSLAIALRAEAFLDPTTELSRLIAECKYEEAFTKALRRSDVKIVSWLCSQVDLWEILSMSPLSQGVLLTLFWLLASDITSETRTKVEWMMAVAVAINPGDSTIAMQMRPVFEQVYQMLRHCQDLPTTSPSEAHQILVLLHVTAEVYKRL